jgi:hypothetical protein
MAIHQSTSEQLKRSLTHLRYHGSSLTTTHTTALDSSSPLCLQNYNPMAFLYAQVFYTILGEWDILHSDSLLWASRCMFRTTGTMPISLLHLGKGSVLQINKLQPKVYLQINKLQFSACVMWSSWVVGFSWHVLVITWWCYFI